MITKALSRKRKFSQFNLQQKDVISRTLPYNISIKNRECGKTDIIFYRQISAFCDYYFESEFNTYVSIRLNGFSNDYKGIEEREKVFLV